MAKPKKIEEWLDEAKELERTYEEVSGTDIPETVEDAINQGWQLAPKGLFIAGLIDYTAEERKADRQRAIPLTVALRLLEEMEDSLIVETIKNPKQIFFAKTRGLVNLVRHAGTALGFIWDVVRLAWETNSLLELITNAVEIAAQIAASIVEIVFRFFGLIFALLLSAASLKAFHSTVIDVQKERELWVATIRKRALPQRRQRRVWRRKVSRL